MSMGNKVSKVLDFTERLKGGKKGAGDDADSPRQSSTNTKV